MDCVLCGQTKFLYKDVSKRVDNNIICTTCWPTKFKCKCNKIISINSVYRHQHTKRHQEHLLNAQRNLLYK